MLLNDADSLENRDSQFIQKLAVLLDATMAPYHRTEVRGLGRVPRQDGLVYVGNHNGYPYMSDAWLFTSALFNEYGMSRTPYILMHELPLRLPLLNQLFTRKGCIRASGQNASRVLERGIPLLVYPGADVELMRPHRDRTRLRFNGRTSHIRLAIKYGVPIVPVVSVGSHSTAMILDDLPWLAQAIGAKSALGINAWPLMLSFPWGLTLGPFIPPYIPWPSKIIIEVLEPMTFSKEGAESASFVAACAAQVEQAVVQALARLEAERMTLERPPLHVLKDAATKALAWLSAHLDELLDWMIAAGTRLVGLKNGASVKPSVEVVGDLRRDADLFRDMLSRASATPEETPPAPAAPATPLGRKPRFTERQILEILEQTKHGKPVSHVCRESGISASTLYRWRSQYDVQRVGSP